MTGKPSDVLEQLNQLAVYFCPGHPKPPWFDGDAGALQKVLADAFDEMKKNRAEIADLTVMRESYSKLYKQIYGGDYG